MKTLSDKECTEWLSGHGIAEAPYGKPSHSPRHYEQYPLPHTAQQISHVARCLVQSSEPFAEALLLFTDWALYQPDEMALVTTIRAAHGEHRRLIDAPGHVFTYSQRELIAGLAALTMSYQWTAYLYFDNVSTFLFWEGDLLDVWARDPAQVDAIRQFFPHRSQPSTQTNS